jgi:hypothetical protein
MRLRCGGHGSRAYDGRKHQSSGERAGGAQPRGESSTPPPALMPVPSAPVALCPPLGGRDDSESGDRVERIPPLSAVAGAGEEAHCGHRGAIRDCGLRCLCWRLNDPPFVWSRGLQLGSILDHSLVRRRSVCRVDATDVWLHLETIGAAQAPPAPGPPRCFKHEPG